VVAAAQRTVFLLSAFSASRWPALASLHWPAAEEKTCTLGKQGTYIQHNYTHCPVVPLATKKTSSAYETLHMATYKLD